MNQYLEFSFTISPQEPYSEILVAELSEIDFESFQENEKGLLAYIPIQDLNLEKFDDLEIFSNSEVTIKHSQKLLPIENWNQVWEDNFEPIIISDKCIVRAIFHEKKDIEFDLVIQPKMAFGTGHHETTHLMIQEILELNLEGKSILDMGCGTGVLGILALKKNASSVKLIDIDDWAYENTKENLILNEGIVIDHSFVEIGEITNLNTNEKFDVIFANINRNVLLDQIEQYSFHLKEKGLLLLSGVLSEDLNIITDMAVKNRLRLINKNRRNNWLQLTFSN